MNEKRNEENTLTHPVHTHAKPGTKEAAQSGIGS